MTSWAEEDLFEPPTSEQPGILVIIKEAPPPPVLVSLLGDVIATEHRIGFVSPAPEIAHVAHPHRIGFRT